MPTIEDARRRAEYLATAATLRTGNLWRGFVEEFPQGWAVWAAPPAGQRPQLGATKTVLDRQTGEFSLWPCWPTDILAAEYAAASEGIVNSVPDNGRPSVFPLLDRTARIEAPDGRVWWRESFLGDDPPGLHPSLAEWLDSRQSLVRGVQRHAEMLVLSRVLHDGSADVLPESAYVAERRPCDTCLQAMVHFRLLDPAAAPSPQAGLLRKDLPAFLDGRAFDPKRWAQVAFDLLAPAIPAVEAARAALECYPAVLSTRRGPGRDCWVRPFRLGVTRDLLRHSAALTGFADLMRAVVFPIGAEEHDDGVIVADGHGRVFVLDQAGAWFCGADIDAALTTLTEGRSPVRVRADGSFI